MTARIVQPCIDCGRPAANRIRVKTPRCAVCKAAHNKEEMRIAQAEYRARGRVPKADARPEPVEQSPCTRCLWLGACRELVHRRTPLAGTWIYSDTPLPCTPGSPLRAVAVQPAEVATGD